MKRSLKIKIPREVVENEKRKRLKRNQSEQFFDDMRKRQDEYKGEETTGKIDLIGPGSCYFFEKLTVNDGTERNIVLFGDQHGSFEFSDYCCIGREGEDTVNTIKERYETIANIILKIKYYDYILNRYYKVLSEEKAMKYYNNIEKLIKKLKRLMIVKKDTGCLTIIDYLNLLSNYRNNYSNKNIYKTNTECIDIFDESNFEIIDDKFSEELGYLGMTRLIYSLCHVSQYCSDMYNNIRFHKTNFRYYVSARGRIYGEHVKSINPNITPSMYESIIKNNRYFSTFFGDLDLDGNFHTMTTLLYFQYLFKPNSYSNVYEIHYLDQMNDIDRKYSALIDNMIIKQFKKSIFYDDPEKFVSILSYVAILKSYLHKSSTVFDTIEDYKMNLYLICRMFIKKDQWRPRDNNSVDPTKKFRNVTHHCSDKTYPENSVVYTGALHSLFCKDFIINYFEDASDKLKINEEERYGRCVKLDYLPFLEQK